MSKNKIRKINNSFISMNFKKILVVFLCVFIFVLLFLLPVIKINEINVNKTYFLTTDEIYKKIGFEPKQSISTIEFLMIKKRLKSKSSYDIQTSYSFDTSILNINIDEFKPIAGIGDQIYYTDGESIYNDTNTNIDVPVLLNLTPTLQNEVMDELSKLNYDIIKQINAISSNSNQVNTSLLLIEMKDGNYVEINANQISQKLKYYNDISLIIRQKNGNKKGIIHLNIGDYYEPF